MSRPNGHGYKDRDAIASCIADAHQTMDAIRGVDQNSPSLAEKLWEPRRQRARV